MTLVPLDGGHGPHGWQEGSFSVLPFLGSLLLVLTVLLALTAVYLWRRGKLSWPKLASAASPEDNAKRILAESFARGDISTEEFMERSSILNWTPGATPLPSRPRWRR